MPSVRERTLRYYSHHLGDYLRDTLELSMLEDGAYRRLLDAYYMREGPLPKDLKSVYRLARAESTQERSAVNRALKFFTLRDGGWHHERCDQEIEAAKKRINTAIENGKRGGKRVTKQEPSGLPDGYAGWVPDGQAPHSPSPSLLNQEKDSEDKNVLSESRRAAIATFAASGLKRVQR